MPCIIGDIKNQNDKGCNQWGHNNGECVVEFIVDKDTWYKGGRGNHVKSRNRYMSSRMERESNESCKWGSYFVNPDFGKDEKIDSNKDESDNDSTQNDDVSTDKDILNGQQMVIILHHILDQELNQ